MIKAKVKVCLPLMIKAKVMTKVKVKVLTPDDVGENNTLSDRRFEV